MSGAAHHITQPQNDRYSAFLRMERALKQVGLFPDRVVLCNDKVKQWISSIQTYLCDLMHSGCRHN